MQVGQVFTRRFWRAVSGVRARGVCIDPPSSKNNTLSVVWIFSLSVNIHKCCRCVASIRYWCANLSSQGRERIFRCETTVIRFEKNVESFFRKRNCCSPSRVRFFESEFFWEENYTRSWLFIPDTTRVLIKLQNRESIEAVEWRCWMENKIFTNRTEVCLILQIFIFIYNQCQETLTKNSNF